VSLIVLGAGGQVGRALTERAGGSARGFDRLSCDICDESSVARALAVPDASFVVNCAAYTAVDRAESERDRAFALNETGAAIVARTAHRRGLPILHLSTDYVYSGEGVTAHQENEGVAPLNVYGESKAAGDVAVTDANPRHILIRVSWVFGVNGANFVKTMLRLGRERSELRIVADQIGGPTEARDIADAVLAIVAAAGRPGFGDWGIYHFAGMPLTSWYGFAEATFGMANSPAPRLVPITTAEYLTPAKRPLNSRLDCSKIRRVFGIARPDWRGSLARVVSALQEGAP
jgi:dTDP-4-dehydrorhamnose reductase